MSDELVTNVNAIEVNETFLKTIYNIDKSVLENTIDDAIKKIPDSCRLVKKA